MPFYRLKVPFEPGRLIWDEWLGHTFWFPLTSPWNHVTKHIEPNFWMQMMFQCSFCDIPNDLLSNFVLAHLYSSYLLCHVVNYVTQAGDLGLRTPLWVQSWDISPWVMSVCIAMGNPGLWESHYCYVLFESLGSVPTLGELYIPHVSTGEHSGFHVSFRDRPGPHIGSLDHQGSHVSFKHHYGPHIDTLGCYNPTLALLTVCLSQWKIRLVWTSIDITMHGGGYKMRLSPIMDIQFDYYYSSSSGRILKT